jgi:hypothetical protein
MNLSSWAERHGITPEAMDELRTLAGVASQPTPGQRALPALSEAGVQTRVRLAWAQRGGALWRNNLGAMEDPHTGGVVRYGLANESAQMNRAIKSADLIGIMPVRITPDMVDSVIGQFVSREVKRPGWRWTGSAREKAQLRWAEIILALGGDAAFTTGDI